MMSLVVRVINEDVLNLFTSASEKERTLLYTASRKSFETPVAVRAVKNPTTNAASILSKVIPSMINPLRQITDMCPGITPSFTMSAIYPGSISANIASAAKSATIQKTIHVYGFINSKTFDIPYPPNVSTAVNPEEAGRPKAGFAEGKTFDA
jgi:hypothetical protein